MNRIEVHKRGPIGEIRLNRPRVLNAQGRDWPDDMLAAAREMQEDGAVRVVLLTGEGVAVVVEIAAPRTLRAARVRRCGLSTSGGSDDPRVAWRQRARGGCRPAGRSTWRLFWKACNRRRAATYGERRLKGHRHFKNACCSRLTAEPVVRGGMPSAVLPVSL